ncbi:SURF1 family protein [soil metagenome]
MSKFWQVARRPKWIAAFVLCLAIAGAFAALGQWQLERSFEAGAPPAQQTETAKPLDTVGVPQKPMPADTTGQIVSLDAEFVADDYIVLEGRINHADPGYWVVGHAIGSDGASVAVALGWAASADEAATAIRALQQTPPPSAVTGRYLPSESPQESDFEAGIRSTLAVAELVNIWSVVPEGVYGGYVIATDAPAGLETIDAPAPSTEVSLNLLNLFYAVEWVIFGGFAIFLWYRLVKDTVEEEAAENTPVE